MKYTIHTDYGVGDDAYVIILGHIERAKIRKIFVEVCKGETVTKYHTDSIHGVVRQDQLIRTFEEAKKHLIDNEHSRHIYEIDRLTKLEEDETRRK